MGVRPVRVVFITVGVAAAMSAPMEGQSICRWELKETQLIGSIDGEDALSEVFDLEVGPNGNIYLAQMFTPYVAVFAPTGDFDRRIGRAGSGPGEFDGNPIRLGLMGDTLWVSDFSTIHFFDREGRAFEQIDFQVVIAREASRVVPGQPLRDGSVLTRRGATTSGGGTMADFFLRERLPVLRASPSGEILDTIAFARQRLTVDYDRRGSTAFAMHPLAGSWRGYQQFTATPDGSSIMLVGEVDEDPPATFEILRVGLEGDTLLSASVPYVPKRISRAHQDWLRDRFGDWQAGDDDTGPSSFPSRSEGARERDRQAARDGVAFPDHYPPVRQIVAGHDGSIWILRELELPELVDRWEVYRSDGVLAGTVVIDQGRTGVLPWMPRVSLLYVTMDEVWGTTLGEFDEPYVHRYELERSCDVN